MEHLGSSNAKKTTTLFLEVADILNITGVIISIIYIKYYKIGSLILFSSVTLNLNRLVKIHYCIFSSQISWSTHVITFRYQNAFIDKL